VQAERARRYAERRTAPWLRRLGVEVPARQRTYHDEERHWRRPEQRRRIEAVILAPDSRCCEILGRDAVTAALERWFDRRLGPVQEIGALYVFEVYHRDLPSFLASRREAPA
jgi:hypothetical protein